MMHSKSIGLPEGLCDTQLDLMVMNPEIRVLIGTCSKMTCCLNFLCIKGHIIRRNANTKCFLLKVRINSCREKRIRLVK